ncbi:MAG: hypothetical protein IKC02_02090 [Oscillospiraceae bacterium]|nr:hypothetical protein [Oscillospiraceae bacterium]
MEQKHLGLRFDSDTHYKLKYIAEYEGRSINKQVLHLIHKCIREFEKENGIIEVAEENR